MLQLLNAALSRVVTSSHLELFVPPGGFVVFQTSGVKLQIFALNVTARKGTAEPKGERQQDLL